MWMLDRGMDGREILLRLEGLGGSKVRSNVPIIKEQGAEINIENEPRARTRRFLTKEIAPKVAEALAATDGRAKVRRIDGEVAEAERRRDLARARAHRADAERAVLELEAPAGCAPRLLALAGEAETARLLEAGAEEELGVLRDLRRKAQAEVSAATDGVIDGLREHYLLDLRSRMMGILDQVDAVIGVHLSPLIDAWRTVQEAASNQDVYDQLFEQARHATVAEAHRILAEREAKAAAEAPPPNGDRPADAPPAAETTAPAGATPDGAPAGDRPAEAQTAATAGGAEATAPDENPPAEAPATDKAGGPVTLWDKQPPPGDGKKPARKGKQAAGENQGS